MTTVISRVYADEATADSVIAQLQDTGFPKSTYDKISSGGSPAEIEATQVAQKTAAVYAGMLTNGATLVVVRAELTPFGAAKAATKIMDAASPLQAEVETETLYIRSAPPNVNIFKGSVLEGGPLFLTTKAELARKRDRGLSASLGLGTLAPDYPRASAWAGKTFLSQRVWPQPLLSSKSGKTSVIPGGKRFFYNPA